MILRDTGYVEPGRRLLKPWQFLSVFVICGFLVAAAAIAEPAPRGKLVDLGGHKLHVNCTGKGSPTVVVENGLGDISANWSLVQSRVSAFTRICTYDRAGYGFSDPGPKPRTFSQINLELHDALDKLGEKGPFVLVGHSFGGPVIRNFAATYPQQVAGMVQVDAALEGQRVGIGGKKTIRLGEGATGKSIPHPHEEIGDSDKLGPQPQALPDELKSLDAMFKVLPDEDQKAQLWAQQRWSLYDAQNSETEWSEEYFAKWLAASQAGILGKIPIIVLTRAEGGYRDEDSDIPAAQLEKERKEGQAKLVSLSSNSKQVIVHSGHNMNLEAPDDVTGAIREVVEAVRKNGKV